MDAHSVQAYEIDGIEVNAAQFTAAACDPQRSVVVEACAGSGKTWLLVARMLRLLLAGAEPAELLAITFTRKAAQEMRWRLMELLKELALAERTQAYDLLRERGIEEHQLSDVLPRAQGLYEQLLASPQGLAMDTFHSWFGRLIQLAPLSSGVPHGFTLTESTAELRREAYGQLMQQIVQPEHRNLKQNLMLLYEEIGDANTKNMLDIFLDKRAEWWAATTSSLEDPLHWLQDMIGSDAEDDARLSVWDNQQFLERIQMIAQCLGKGSSINQTRAIAIETALTAGASVENFTALAHEFYGNEGTNRKNRRTKDLCAAIEKWLGVDNEDAFDDECNAIAEELKHLERRSQEHQVLAVNAALFSVGNAYVDCYQTLKAAQRVFDFSDLEWQAYRLLSHDEFAAYLLARLDARYKHILLDEFQDTNPLQWSIVKAWLDAYGDDTQRPTVFIVGDPKQSIYRFRRAEPRVFAAARTLLTRQGARFLRTNQTRRNGCEIVASLNHAMRANPIFQAQTTASNEEGDVWRLPLIHTTVELDAKSETTPQFSLRDPFTTPLLEQEDQRRYHEGLQVAQALYLAKNDAENAHSNLTWQWSNAMLLVRRRSHLALYEKALREYDIPYVSNRRGGLLDALEIADVIALLTFLVTPGDNRSLAHVLKSPMFGASDDDLIVLAHRTESSWWKRVIAYQEMHPTHVVLSRATHLLHLWMQTAHDLPVHDLLDTILHQGQLIERYAQAVSFADRSQVLGNLTAFTEFALNLDGGRYPSLPKFIAALDTYRQGGESDAPDESSVDSVNDAVRILTIHSAKGLEADIVVMLDSNHSEARKDTMGILCQWPLQENEEKHFSAYGNSKQRGAARDAIFAAEEAQAKQESWNLLYVSMTRAKRLLMVSGVANDKAKETEGITSGAWYQHFMHIDETRCSSDENFHPYYDMGSADMSIKKSKPTSFSLAVFDPPMLALAPTDALPIASTEQIEGIALHALMERITTGKAHDDGLVWPIAIPETEVIAAWLPCANHIALTVKSQAQCILSNPALEIFFHPGKFSFSRNEMDIVFEGNTLRIDRLVAFENEVWILDYKRQLLETERQSYTEQLQHYRAAVAAIYTRRMIRTGLILADGQMIEIV